MAHKAGITVTRTDTGIGYSFYIPQTRYSRALLANFTRVTISGGATWYLGVHAIENDKTVWCRSVLRCFDGTRIRGDIGR